MIFDPINDLQENHYDTIFVYQPWEELMAELSEKNTPYFYYVRICSSFRLLHTSNCC